jgi:DNA repair exonuclease SbcCD ATPase subunit
MQDSYETKFKKCEKELLKVNHELDMLYEKYDTKTSDLKQRIRDLEKDNTRNNNTTNDSDNLKNWVERFETLHINYEDLRERYNVLTDKYNKDIEDITTKYNNLATESHNKEKDLVEKYNNLRNDYIKLGESNDIMTRELTKCGYKINYKKTPTPARCEGTECTIMGGKKQKTKIKHNKVNKISRKQKYIK